MRENGGDGAVTGIGKSHFDLMLSALITLEGESGRNFNRRRFHEVGLCDEITGDFSNVEDFADGDGGEGNTTISDRDDIVVMEVAGLRNGSGLAAAGGGESDVFDAIARAIVAHGVNVAGENGGDVSGFLEAFVNFFPIVAIAAAEPAGVVEENENVLGFLGFFESAIEPGELLGAHFLSGWFSKGSLSGFGIAFIGIEDDEP